MKELKRTEYNHFKATVIGSREQMCIQPNLKKLSNADKTLECKSLRKSKTESCAFHSNLNVMHSIPEFKKNVMDMEDLRKAGKKYTCCPYYAAKTLAEQAQVIFMPYNVGGRKFIAF